MSFTLMQSTFRKGGVFVSFLAPFFGITFGVNTKSKPQYDH